MITLALLQAAIMIIFPRKLQLSLLLICPGAKHKFIRIVK